MQQNFVIFMRFLEKVIERATLVWEHGKVSINQLALKESNQVEKYKKMNVFCLLNIENLALN